MLVTFIRHGMSCGNAIAWSATQQTLDALETIAASLQINASDVASAAVRDPPLCELGIQDSKSSAGFYAAAGADFVGSSVLQRALQTAHHTFPGRMVRVLPSIGETDFDQQNEPMLGVGKARLKECLAHQACSSHRLM